MFAKRFFYVSAGIFLLALSYHLGAQSAAATGGSIEGGVLRTENGVSYASFTSNRLLYAFQTSQFGNGDWTPNEHPVPSSPVPGTEPVVSTMMRDSQVFVLLANGDAYYSNDGEPWVASGNLLGKPTPVIHES
jgi:hypothetical protein